MIENSNIKMTTENVITLGSPANLLTEKNIPEFYGKYIAASGKNNLVLGIYASKEDILKYSANSEIIIYYLYSNVKYHFKAKIIYVRPAIAEDSFEIDEKEVDSDIINEFKKKSGTDIYIMEVAAETMPEISNKREFFRLPLQMEIYFKEIAIANIEDITETDLKFEISKAVMYKKEADSGILDEEAGYLKIITADISAGGFMFKSPAHFELEMFLECMMMVDREALPAVAKVLRSRHDEILNGYFIHAQFYKISEPVRDRLIKYLINRQRRQTRFLRR